MINQRVMNKLFNKTIKRSFSSAVTPATQTAADNYRSLWQVSEIVAAEAEANAAEEAGYLEKLKAMNAKRGEFAPFQAAADDVPEVSKIKNKINAIVEKELVLQDFKDQLDKEAL